MCARCVSGDSLHPEPPGRDSEQNTARGDPHRDPTHGLQLPRLLLLTCSGQNDGWVALGGQEDLGRWQGWGVIRVNEWRWMDEWMIERGGR